MPDIELSVFEQQTYTIDFSLPVPPLPLPSLPALGVPQLTLKQTCPGWPLCGREDEPCKISLKTPAIPILPELSLPFPPTLNLPSIHFEFTFPPAIVVPLTCPLYPSDSPSS